MPVSLDDVAVKVGSGERLTGDDLEALEVGRNIVVLGMMAESVRRKLHNNTATFVRVFDLEITGQQKPALRKTLIPQRAGEVRIFETPPSLDAAVDVVSDARDLAGDIPLSAFCLFELSKLPEGLPVVLAALKKAGLELVTQAPLDRLKSPERALEAVTDAGLRVARLTINETPDRPWTDVCREVAAHQRRLQSIRAFAPLARKIDDTQPTTGYADVRRVALARLLVENVETIQVDWALYGPKLAQVALMFGADDLDSVSAIDDDSLGHRRSPLEEIRRSVQAASLTPIERDGRFRLF